MTIEFHYDQTLNKRAIEVSHFSLPYLMMPFLDIKNDNFKIKTIALRVIKIEKFKEK